MVLEIHPPFPAHRSYVIKLHRDARLIDGELVGRLESVATGEQFQFGSGQELLERLLRDAMRQVDQLRTCT